MTVTVTVTMTVTVTVTVTVSVTVLKYVHSSQLHLTCGKAADCLQGLPQAISSGQAFSCLVPFFNPHTRCLAVCKIIEPSPFTKRSL